MNKFSTTVRLLTVIALALTMNGCKKESGCTDPTAANYNSNANVDNGTCQYNSGAVFYSDVPLQATATVTVSGLNPSTASITGYVTGGGTPACNVNGLGNFSTILTVNSTTATYSYTVAMPGSAGWTGSVTFTQSNCTPVLLPAGNITFYTLNSSYASILPIVVTINGYSANITSILSAPPTACQTAGCASFGGLPLTTYSYSAVATPSNAGAWGPSNITITSDGQCNFVALN